MATLEQSIQQSKFANQRIKANLNLLYTSNWLYNKISSNLKPFGLTPEQFNTLRILKGTHPECMCQKDILSRMLAPNSNLTLIIKKLVAKKFVTVEQSEFDKREYAINITKTGIQLLKDIDKHMDTSVNSISTLSESEAFHLNALLDKLRDE